MLKIANGDINFPRMNRTPHFNAESVVLHLSGWSHIFRWISTVKLRGYPATIQKVSVNMIYVPEI